MVKIISLPNKMIDTLNRASRKTVIIHFRKNCSFWLAASTTKDENNYALAGEESSDRDWCCEPE